MQPPFSQANPSPYYCKFGVFINWAIVIWGLHKLGNCNLVTYTWHLKHLWGLLYLQTSFLRSLYHRLSKNIAHLLSLVKKSVPGRNHQMAGLNCPGPKMPRTGKGATTDKKIFFRQIFNERQNFTKFGENFIVC